MQQQERSKMLGTMPMNKLVPKVAVPIMISMLVQALYNVVDGIFVSRYSAEALTAVSVACLTIYDMVKAVEKGVRIEAIHLIEKSGGKSGHWQAGPDGSPDRR